VDRYLDFASRTRVLVVSGTVFFGLALVVFPALPVVGGRLIDLPPGYGYEELMALLGDYGERGRWIHALATPSVDTLFPLAYVTFFVGLIRRLRPSSGRLARLPVLLGAVDLCENAQITAMLLLYPAVPRALVESASLFTLTKHGLTAASVLAVLFAGVVAWMDRRRGGARAAP